MILRIDPSLEQPIYAQLRDQIVLGIAGGQFEPGEQLPSVRRLAADLGINPHTVNKTYQILGDEGYLLTDRRKRAVIANPHPGTNFVAELKSRIMVNAAAARIHGLSDLEFTELCADCYRKSAKV
jgi:GntR family transcriptional regulator